jgi:hypothetical protein
MKSIEEIMAIGNPMTIYTLLTSYKKPFHKTIEQTESEYNPMKHKVMDTQYRKKKAIKVKTNKVDFHIYLGTFFLALLYPKQER